MDDGGALKEEENGKKNVWRRSWAGAWKLVGPWKGKEVAGPGGSGRV